MASAIFTKRATAEARRVRESAKRIAQAVPRLKRPEVAAAFDMIPLNLRRNVSLHLSEWNDTVTLILSLRNLDSFKDKRLTNLLERFIDWDVHVSEYTYSDTPNKDFEFSKVYNDLRVQVKVFAYVKSDSPLCRVVVTGMKEEVVRTEIKEIVCA